MPGELPTVAPLPTAPGTTVPATVAPTTTTLAPTTTTRPPVGVVAAGNRVLLLGDSILASMSRRYTNEMCTQLESARWAVEIEAESGRFVDFGRKVLRKLEPSLAGVFRAADASARATTTALEATAPTAAAGGSVAVPTTLAVPPPVTVPAKAVVAYDVVVIGFGSNYRLDQRDYLDQLTALVDAVAPAQVVLVTVTEVDASRREVNAAIRAVAAARRERVRIFDWARLAAANKTFLVHDGLHLTELGRTAYASALGAVLGEAPSGEPTCAKSVFTDDSAGSVWGSG